MNRIEHWKVDEVRKYLERAFRDCRIDDYPKGSHTSHQFLVMTQRPMDQHRVAHQLLVTRGFFDRFTDPTALGEGLRAGDVLASLKRAGERTVELY